MVHKKRIYKAVSCDTALYILLSVEKKKYVVFPLGEKMAKSVNMKRLDFIYMLNLRRQSFNIKFVKF